ncbi:MAG TPA: sulfotransferase domain-containing protein [Patescibacteria group bacterium]|nr:sulfotransferase domain-containing protein [Patescibacteria group bacterium]
MMNSTDLIFCAYTLNRRWFNGSLMVHRNFDGHIVSMQQSGSHWIKNQLASVLAQLYGLPPLAHVQDDSIIGHTKTPPKYKNIPQIVHSHGYPHGLTLKVPGLHYPKYLVLVRDLRDSLVSHWERFRGEYDNCSFDEYLRGDVRQDKFESDIWSRMRFMNEWGRVLAKNPHQVMALRYEDMKADAGGSLRRVCDYFSIKGVSDAVVAQALTDASRDKMAEKPNPNLAHTVIRREDRTNTADYFTGENARFFEATTARYLKHDFGYGLPTQQRKAA